MDLWIRSQDEKRLVKVFDIYIGGTYGSEIKANYAGYHSGCSYIDLGEYKTKERALEVLDEIEKLLMPTYLISNISINEGKKLQENLSYGTSMIQTCDDSKIESLNGSILYIMPKE